ncbi:MAG: hypothetical protein HZB26_10790 [Candidatus Hydrogenedentes bacterium]|nr:hypothetical protein [Candidatus Hydrogenedentota bacterium]
MLVLLTLLTLAAPPDSAIPVGIEKQLFLDDSLIASKGNITRRIHPAEKYPGNPVLRATEPWEGKVAIVYGSVLRDQGHYRIWYYCDGSVAYAESDDGIAWRKPSLDVIEKDGRKTNLVVDRNAAEGEPGYIPYFYEIFGVFNDTRESDPARRYKMGYLSVQRNYNGPREDPYHKGERRGLGVAGSPDGIHWTVLDSWATEATCDGATHWMFDPARQKYVMYGRKKYIAPDLKEHWKEDEWFTKHYWGRVSARAESSDFLHWDCKDPGSAPVVLGADTFDPPSTEIYGMYVWPCGAGYLGLAELFYNRPDDTHLDQQLTYSRDSVHFERVGDRTPFIPCGPVGSWDRFNSSLATNPPVEVGDELRFYYGGRTYRHGPYNGPDKGDMGGAIGFASVKRDRFVSLEASFDGGQIITKPVRLENPVLHLNVKSDFGRIIVRVVDPSGATIAASKPVTVDSLDARVEWESGSAPKPDAAVKLHITLQNALLYALWTAP